MTRSRSSKRFVFLLVAVVMAMTLMSAQGAPISHELTMPQQHAVVGGTGCDFVGGLSVGLGVAGLFGCIPCGVGSVVLGLGYVIAC
jgi:hypothetical protein